MTVIPSCPWCSKRTSVERLPRLVGGKEWVCTDCDVVMSGSTDEAWESRFQRQLVTELKATRTPPVPTQEELPTDAQVHHSRTSAHPKRRR